MPHDFMTKGPLSSGPSPAPDRSPGSGPSASTSYRLGASGSGYGVSIVSGIGGPASGIGVSGPGRGCRSQTASATTNRRIRLRP